MPQALFTMRGNTLSRYIPMTAPGRHQARRYASIGTGHRGQERSVAGRLVIALVIHRVADNGEGSVQLHVDLASVVERHFDLVVALLVADLGTGDPAFTRVVESGGGSPGEIGAGDARCSVIPTGGRRDAGRGADRDPRRPRLPRGRTSFFASWEPPFGMRAAFARHGPMVTARA